MAISELASLARTVTSNACSGGNSSGCDGGAPNQPLIESSGRDAAGAVLNWGGVPGVDVTLAECAAGHARNSTQAKRNTQ